MLSALARLKNLAAAGILAVLSACPLATAKENKVSVEYDRFENVTVIHSPIISHILDGDPILDAQYLCHGNTPSCHPDQVFLAFLTGHSVSSGWHYLKYHDLILLLPDGTRIEAAGRWDGDTHSGDLTEHIQVSLSVEDFLKLVKYAKADGRLGTSEFHWGPKDMDKLRILASGIGDK